LYLEGTENTIRRVTAETNYSCLMLKTQRFSSLFRHYAKYHGLRKDDLEYYFVNPLENEDTPESVQLQRGDTIMVRRKRKPEPPEQAADDTEYFADMRELLEDTEHMDAIFVCYKNGGGDLTSKSRSTPEKPLARDSGKAPTETPEEGMSVEDMRCISNDNGGGTTPTSHAAEYETVEIRAHKCILTARAEYFKALFRKSGFRESDGGKIYVDKCFPPDTVRKLLEFVYSNRIVNIKDCTAQELLDLLHISNRWLLRDLKRLCEYELMRLMDIDNVARMYCATEEYKAGRLARACIEFIMDNLRQVTSNRSFTEEMKHYPHLLMPILKAAADVIGEPATKKLRTTENAASPVACDS